MSDSKKKSNYKTILINGTKVKVRHRLQFRKSSNFISGLKQYTREGLKESLLGLQKQVKDWRLAEPESPLAQDTNIKTTAGEIFDHPEHSEHSELSDLEGHLSDTLELLEKGNDFGLALNMFTIGEWVGRLNHIEGWTKAVLGELGAVKNLSKGAASRKEKSVADKKLIREWVIKYLKKNPYDYYQQAVDALRRSELKGVAGEYEDVTIIRRMLNGAQKEVREQLNKK